MFYTEFSEDYEEIFPFSREVYSLLKEYSGHAGSRILDLGCGTGPLCGNFASEGHEVTGLDLDSGMIETARKNWPDVDFRLMNMVDIGSLSPGFDLIYSTGNVMAHITKSDFGNLLSVIRNLLNPGRVWLFQVINWDFILDQVFFRFPEIESGTKIFYRTYTDISSGGLSFNTELKNKSNGKSVFKDSTRLYPVTSKEYIRMHEASGLRLTDHFAGYGKAPFNSNNFSADIYAFKKTD